MPRADHRRRRRLRAARLVADAVGPIGADPGPGRSRRERRGLLRERRPRRTRGRSSRRSGSSSTPSPSGSASSSCTASCSTRSRAGREAVEGSRRPAARGLVGHRRLPAQDRSAPARPHLAPDAQLPLLERRGRGPGSPAALHRDRTRARGAPDENRPIERRSLESLLARRRGGLPDRRPAPVGRRDPLVHPEVDQGRQVGLPRRGGGEPGDVRHGDRAGARPLSQLGPRRPASCLAHDPGRAAGLARPPLPHRRPRVHRRREGLHRRRRLLRPDAPRHLPAEEPRQASAGRAAGLFLAAQIVRKSTGVRRRARAHPDPEDLVRHVGRHPELHRVQPASRTSTTGSTSRSTRSGASTRTSSRSSRTPSSRRRSSRASRSRSTTSRSARSSCAARASSRTASASAFSGKYKSLFLANQGTKSGAPRGADGRRSPRSTPRSSGRTRSSTAPSAASSTSTRRWGS